MRRRPLVLAAVLLAALLAGVPVAGAQKPPPPATPQPPGEQGPPSEPGEAPPQPTSVVESKPPVPPTPAGQAKPTAPPTPTPTGAVKPTAPPTPGAGSGEEGEPQVPPTPLPTAAQSPVPPSRTAAPTAPPTHVPTQAPAVIAGHVFEDANDNGLQDAGEGGIEGVAVTLDGRVVGVTGAGGAFAVPAGRGKALLAVVPPAGYRWAGPGLDTSFLPLDAPVAFALQREGARDAPAAAAAVSLPAAGSAVVVAGLLAVLAFDGAATLVLVAAVRAGNRQALRMGLARLEAAREQLERQVAVEPDEVVPRLGRLALEATGERAGIDQVIDLSADPVPAVVALGRDFAHYVFTTAEPKVARRVAGLLGERPRKARCHPIDASTSGLTAAAELAEIWRLEAGERGVGEPLLPRTARWYLYVVEQPMNRQVGR